MANVLMTMAEETERTTPTSFEVFYRVDEEDCFDFAEQMRGIGHSVFYVNWNDLKDGEFTRMFDSGKKEFISPVNIDDMNLVFVYKMEDFLGDMSRFKKMISRFEQSPAVVVNDPATIRHNIDKSYFWDLESKGVRIIPTYQLNGNIDSLLDKHGKVVVKPKNGERGMDQILAASPSDIASLAGSESDYIVQRFMPEIINGERSLIFLGFDYQHAVLKKPGKGEYKCNESLGGTVQVLSPTQEELDFAQNVLKVYASLGLPVHFSRIDIMESEKGPVLIEAELLNPSIYANYIGKGPKFGKSIAKYFDKLIRDNKK